MRAERRAVVLFAMGVWAGGAGAASAFDIGDIAWMRKVDFAKVKQATDRCKKLRRSCLAFGEEPIPAKDWSWILDGLSPEETEVMRRRYSIPPQVMTEVNAASIRLARGRPEELRDAVGSTPPGFRREAAGRIARIAGGATPQPVRADPPRVVEAAAKPSGSGRGKAAAPPPAPGTTRRVPPERLARLNRPLARAAQTGRLDADSLAKALAWAKANPPMGDAERRLRERAQGLRRMMGKSLSGSDAAAVRELARDSGLTLSKAEEENLIRAIEGGLSWGEKFRLWRAF
ncbi:MAG: hypothetical protein HY928_04795 [Elusimicrobia bacterium]|nr:hypothetical protein [Elusimicrobiota bacterium]